MRSKRFEKLTDRPINRETFILIDHVIARHALNPDVAERAMNTPSREIARRLVDINVPRATILELASGCSQPNLLLFQTKFGIMMRSLVSKQAESRRLR